MHALTFIIIFIIGAIVAAGEGDWSGIAAIGQFIGGAALIIGFLLLMTNPIAMLIAVSYTHLTLPTKRIV